MSVPVLAAVAALIALAALVQGATGFGFGMVAMATIPLLIGVKAAAPLVVVFGWLLNTVLLARLWDAVSGQRLWPTVLGAMVGTPIGVTVLASADPRQLLLALGVLLVFFAWWLGRSGAVRERRPAWGVAAGVVGGLMGGAFNTGGPPVVAYVSSKPWPPRVVRATLQGHFLLVGVVQLSLFASAGLLTAESLWLNLLLLPALVVGALLGDALSGRLSPERFRLLIRVGLAVLGVVMLVRVLG